MIHSEMRLKARLGMRALASGITAFLLVAGLAFGEAQEGELLRRAAVIKPRPDELKWQQVPWVTEVAEAQRLARAEGRPNFLVAFADGPLERV